MPHSCFHIRSLAAVLAAFACGASSADAEAPADANRTTGVTANSWPLFRGDAQATGVAVSSLPERPKLLWRYVVDGGAFDGTPAIAEGLAVIGDLDGVLYALDLNTGKEKWRLTLKESGFIASPSIRDGRVYIGDVYGVFLCVDLQTGKELWQFETDNEIDGGANLLGENVLFGSQDSRLYCLSAKTGVEAWRAETADQIRCFPSLADGRTFVAGCDGELHVFSAATGKEQRSVPIKSPTMCTPAADGDFVYFGVEQGGAFLAVNWRKGEVAWTYRDPDSPQGYRASAAIAKDRVIVAGRNKAVLALAKTDGKELWRYQGRKRIDSSPVIVEGRVFVGTGDGQLIALDLQTGKLQWQYEAGGEFIGGPAVADGRLVIANDRGVVFCFGGQ